jgi:hypothetical protein
LGWNLILITGNKRTPFLIAVVLAIIGLAGTVLSFSSPAVTTAKQTSTQLNYTQTGTFDYKASIGPAYFYNTTQQVIPTSPNIPVKFINSLTMSYKYTSPADNVQVEVDAVVEKANNWQKTVVIVPKQAQNGNFLISFPIDLQSIQTLAATIDKELLAEGQQSYGTTSLNIDVNVIVYDKTTTFMHTLTVTLGQTYLVIDKNLLQTQNGLTGIYSYQVALADNTLFGATTISSPQVSLPPPTILGSNDTIFTRLIDALNFTYQYNVTSDQVMPAVETIDITAVLENPEKWSKTFVLVPVTQKSGNFTLNFPVDLQQYLTLINNTQSETGVSASAYNLIIKANVHLQAQTAFGAVDKVFSDNISTNLQSGVLAWTGDLSQSDKGSITTTTNVQVPAKILKVKVDTFRVVSIFVLCLGLGMMAALLLIRVHTGDKSALAKKSAQETERKFSNMIITVVKMPETKAELSILTVDSLDELIKVAQSLFKPINHAIEGPLSLYWVNDGTTRYEYRLNLT